MELHAKTRLTAMPRPRQQMTNQLNALKDTLQEHVCKLVFFHSYRPLAVSNWLASLNKHLRLLRVYNEGARGRLNYTRAQLELELDEYALSILEAGVYEWTAASPPYPEVQVTEETRRQCLMLVSRYIDCILDVSKRLTSEDVEALGPSPSLT